VTAVEKDGRLRFRRVGGIDPRILLGQVFRVGMNGARGVVGVLPAHLLSNNDMNKVTPIEELFLDIGAGSREEALQAISIGDLVAFDTTYEASGRLRKGKAFDDRVGCAVLASLVQKRPPVPVTAVWTVQEEIGTRGAAAAARRVTPDLAIILEGTASGESPGSSAEEQQPRRVGPVVGGMRHRVRHDTSHYRLVEARELLEGSRVVEDGRRVVELGPVGDHGDGASLGDRGRELREVSRIVLRKPVWREHDDERQSLGPSRRVDVEERFAPLHEVRRRGGIPHVAGHRHGCRGGGGCGGGRWCRGGGRLCRGHRLHRGRLGGGRR